MPFNPTKQVGVYHPSPPPILPGSDKLYIERELKKISQKMNETAQAVQEIQTYLENNS